MLHCLRALALLLALAIAGPAMAQDHGDPAGHTVADVMDGVIHADQSIANEVAGDDHGAGYGAHGPERELVPGLGDSALYWEMVWTVVVFSVFFLTLSFLVWPRVLKALQAREQKQEGDLASAEQARDEAKRTLDEYKKQLADARVEAQKIMDQARGEAEKAAASIKTDAEREINVMKERAQRDIAGAREDALAEIYAQTATLATSIAGRILHREIRPEDQQALVDESLRELRTRN